MPQHSQNICEDCTEHGAVIERSENMQTIISEIKDEIAKQNNSIEDIKDLLSDHQIKITEKFTKFTDDIHYTFDLFQKGLIDPKDGFICGTNGGVEARLRNIEKEWKIFSRFVIGSTTVLTTVLITIPDKIKHLVIWIFSKS